MDITTDLNRHRLGRGKQVLTKLRFSVPKTKLGYFVKYAESQSRNDCYAASYDYFATEHAHTTVEKTIKINHLFLCGQFIVVREWLNRYLFETTINQNNMFYNRVIPTIVV